MVKILTSRQEYAYPFPTVTLAYFLRYPNPFATHVLSSDVISRHYDPETQRLHTTRLHLKQSRLPAAVMALLPSNILGNGSRGPNGEAQNFILEKSVVDIKEGWMETETQNLQYKGVLTVIEKQRYELDPANVDKTDVSTSATFYSRFGQMYRRKKAGQSEALEDELEAPVKQGFFSRWGTGTLQRTIESTGLKKTQKALMRSKEGMTVVLERIRNGGLREALEGMQRDSLRVGMTPVYKNDD